MITDLRRVAEQAADGAPLHEELRAGVIGLAGAVLQHNILEEKLLEQAAAELDIPGPLHARVFSDEHADEHEELYATLVGIPRTPIEFAGGGVTAMLDSILEHMGREESALLDADMRRGEGVVPGADPDHRSPPA
jgi:hypothetical protein